MNRAKGSAGDIEMKVGFIGVGNMGGPMLPQHHP
jgi:hypothetical protein